MSCVCVLGAADGQPGKTPLLKSRAVVEDSLVKKKKKSLEVTMFNMVLVSVDKLLTQECQSWTERGRFHF